MEQLAKDVKKYPDDYQGERAKQPSVSMLVKVLSILRSKALKLVIKKKLLSP